MRSWGTREPWEGYIEGRKPEGWEEMLCVGGLEVACSPTCSPDGDSALASPGQQALWL